MRHSFLLFIILVFSSSVATAADNNDACGAFLCLAGEMQGNTGGQSCSSYTSKYFAIQSWKRGKFKPSQTLIKRSDWLSGCKSADPTMLSQVNNSFGSILR